MFSVSLSVLPPTVGLAMGLEFAGLALSGQVVMGVWGSLLTVSSLTRRTDMEKLHEG